MQKIILLLCSICLANAEDDFSSGSKGSSQSSALSRQQMTQIIAFSNALNNAQDSISEKFVITAFKELSNLIDPQTLCSIVARIQEFGTKQNLKRTYCYDNPSSDMAPLDSRFYASFLKKLSLKVEKDSYDKFVKFLRAELDEDFWSEISKKLAPAQADVVQVDPQVVLLSGILNRIASTRSLPQNFVFTIFDIIQATIDDPLLFQLINGLQSDDLKSQLMAQYFPSGYKGQAKSATVLDNQFYATFLDALSNLKEMTDDLMVKISDTMKPYLRKDWDAIDKLRQQAATSNDPWEQSSSGASQELDKILKGKTVNMNAVKAQLVLDFVDAYKQAPDQAPSFGFGDDDKPANFAKLKNAVDSVKTTYRAKLSQKNIQTDSLLPLLDGAFSEAIGWAAPRFTVSFFNQYVNNITTADTKAKVLGGSRIDIDKAFVDYQTAKGNKSAIVFNSDYMYLLCFQMLAGLEAKIIKSNSSTKYDDFAKQAVDTLDKLAQGLNHEGSIDGIVKSIKSGIPSRIEKTPDTIIIGRFVGLIINKLQIPSDILGILNTKLKAPLTELQTSSESVKAFEGVLKDHLKSLSNITTISPANTVSFLNVTAPAAAQAEDKKDDIIDKATKIADSPFGQKLWGSLGGLFG